MRAMETFGKGPASSELVRRDFAERVLISDEQRERVRRILSESGISL